MQSIESSSFRLQAKEAVLFAPPGIYRYQFQDRSSQDLEDPLRWSSGYVLYCYTK